MREWAFSICLAIIVGCIIRIISPNGGMGKMINFSMGMFLLIIMFSGFVFKDINLEPDLDIFNKWSDIDEKLEILKNNKTLGEIEKRLELMVKQDLLLKNINPLKILININTNNKSSILIKRMEIFMKEGEEYDEKMIKDYINDRYRVIPDIKS